MPKVAAVSYVIEDQKVFKVVVSNVGEAGNRFTLTYTFRGRADAERFRAAQVRKIVSTKLKKCMPKYRIGVFEEISGYITVTAKTKRAAEKNVLGLVELEGFDSLLNAERLHLNKQCSVEQNHRYVHLA